MKTFFRVLALTTLKGYQLILSPAVSVVFGIHCRYEESCSRYAERMIKTNGLFKGLILALARVLSCNPWANPVK